MAVHIDVIVGDKDSDWDRILLNAISKKLTRAFLLLSHESSNQTIIDNNDHGKSHIAIVRAPKRKISDGELTPLRVHENKAHFYERINSISSVVRALSKPEIFHIIFYDDSEENLESDLNSWAETKGLRIKKSQFELLRKSFVTVSDLSRPGFFRHYANYLWHFSGSAVFDPTGIRKFVQFCIAKTAASTTLQQSTKYPPCFALVADDDKPVADYHAYLLFRMGYSVCVARSCEAMRFAEKIRYDFYAIDKNIFFDDWKSEETNDVHNGEVYLASRIKHTAIKLLISGGKKELGNDTTLVQKPVKDLFSFLTEVKTKIDFDPSITPCEEPLSSDSYHQIIAKSVRMAGYELRSRAKRLLASGNVWQACIHWLDAYEISKGRDGILALESFTKVQVHEVKAMSDFGLVTKRRLWGNRFQEIESKIKLAFASRGADSRHEDSQLMWWRFKIYSNIHKAMSDEKMPYEIRSMAVYEIRESLALIWRSESNPWKWVRAILLQVWNRFTTRNDSLPRISLLWALGIAFFFFANLYVFDSSVSNTFLATLLQGVGSGIECDLLNCQSCQETEKAVLELASKVFSVLILARLVDHLISRFKEP